MRTDCRTKEDLFGKKVFITSDPRVAQWTVSNGLYFVWTKQSELLINAKNHRYESNL